MSSRKHHLPEALTDMPPGPDQPSSSPPPPPKRTPMFSVSSSESDESDAMTPATKNAPVAKKLVQPSSSDDEREDEPRPRASTATRLSHNHKGPLRSNATIRFDADDSSTSSSSDGGFGSRFRGRTSSMMPPSGRPSTVGGGRVSGLLPVIVMDADDDKEPSSSPLQRPSTVSHKDPHIPETVGANFEDVEAVIPSDSMRLGFDVAGRNIYEHHSAFSAVHTAGSKVSILSSFTPTAVASTLGGGGSGMLAATTSVQTLGGVVRHITSLVPQSAASQQGSKEGASGGAVSSSTTASFAGLPFSVKAPASIGFPSNTSSPQQNNNNNNNSDRVSSKGGLGSVDQSTDGGDMGLGTPRSVSSLGNGSDAPYFSDDASDSDKGPREGDASKRASGRLTTGRARGVSTVNLSESFVGIPQGSSIASFTSGGTSPSPAASPASRDPRRSLTMDYGDEYIGEVARLDGPWAATANAPVVYVPHGRGTLQSATGQHCYIGNFAYRAREGHGKLVTSRFVLWCMWKSNRPDLSQPARIDFVNGDRYSGYLNANTDTQRFTAFINHALAAKEAERKGKQASSSLVVDPMLPEPMSKFSAWVNSTTFQCFKWGELVSAGTGTRFFGQWVGGVQTGYGVQIFSSGDRYVGMFRNNAYQGPGAFFTSRNRGVCSECIRRAEASYQAVAQLDSAQIASLNDEISKLGARARQHIETAMDEAWDVGRPSGVLDDGTLGGGALSPSPYTQHPAPSPTRAPPKVPSGMPPSLSDGADLTDRSAATNLSPIASLLDVQAPANSRLGGLPNCGLRAPLGPKPGATVTKNVFANIPRDGTVFDGLWQNGQFCGEASHVTLPDRTRITATWSSFNKALEGAVFAPTAESKLRRWREHFHWEPLFGSGNPKGQERDHVNAARVRRKLRSCGSKSQIMKALAPFVARHPTLLNGIKVFRRFFFVSFGSCGNPSELGAGGGQSTGYAQGPAATGGEAAAAARKSSNDDAGKRKGAAVVAPHESLGRGIGWCKVRNPAGGCIHPGKGRPIVPGDLEAALTDIFSFLASAKRYIEDLLAEADDDDSTSDSPEEENEEEKADPPSLLEGTTVPLDSVSAAAAQQPSATVEIHDLEEKYRYALDAFHDLDGGTIIERIMFDCILKEVHDPLMNLYAHVHASELRAVEVALQQLSGITLDDLGVNFGRHEADEKLFNPYAEAERALESISGERTLSGKLGSLRRWSHAIDASTKLAQLRLTTGEAPGDSAAATKSTIMAKASASVESGSTDDLLPIHQHVLIKAAVPRLFLEARLLQDLTSSETLIDMTSQDSFCITTLQACISTIPELDIDVRDNTAVLTPTEVFAKKAEDVLLSTAAFASIEPANFRPLEVTLLSLAAYAKFVQSPDHGPSMENTHTSLAKFERFQRSLARCIHSRLPSPLTMVPVTGNHLATFQYIQSWVPFLLDAVAGVSNGSAQMFHWQQQHIWFQRRCQREKQARKLAKTSGGHIQQQPEATPESRVEKPPVLFLNLAYVANSFCRLEDEATDRDGHSLLRTLLSLPELPSGEVPHNDAATTALPRWLTDLDAASSTFPSLDEDPLTVNAVHDMLFTQSIAGVTDLPESVLVARNPDSTSEASEASSSNPYDAMCDVASLKATLLSLFESGSLESSLSRIDCLLGWYVCSPPGVRRACHAAKALHAACRSVQAVGLELCYMQYDENRGEAASAQDDDSSGGRGWQWLSAGGRSALVLPPFRGEAGSNPLSTSNPLTTLIPMKSGRLAEVLGMVEVMARIGRDLRADLDRCAQAAMESLRRGEWQPTSPLPAFEERLRRLVQIRPVTDEVRHHAHPSKLPNGNDSSELSASFSSEWSFDEPESCDVSDSGVSSALDNTLAAAISATVASYEELCRCCGEYQGTLLGSLARGVRDLVQEAVANSRFVLRFDMCHDSVVYKEAARALLSCDPKDAS